MNTDLVLTNVIVRDKKTGAVVTGLKASDFTILENGKPQRIHSFDFQNVNDRGSPVRKQDCDRPGKDRAAAEQRIGRRPEAADATIA